jgi:hypothetical protein
MDCLLCLLLVFYITVVRFYAFWKDSADSFRTNLASFPFLFDRHHHHDQTTCPRLFICSFPNLICFVCLFPFFER